MILALVKITILSQKAVYNTMTRAAWSSAIELHKRRPSHALIATLLS